MKAQSFGYRNERPEKPRCKGRLSVLCERLYIPLCQTHLHGQIDTHCRQETQYHKIVHPLTKFHKHSLLNLTFCGENTPIQGKFP